MDLRCAPIATCPEGDHEVVCSTVRSGKRRSEDGAEEADRTNKIFSQLSSWAQRLRTEEKTLWLSEFGAPARRLNNLGILLKSLGGSEAAKSCETYPDLPEAPSPVG